MWMDLRAEPILRGLLCSQQKDGRTTDAGSGLGTDSIELRRSCPLHSTAATLRSNHRKPFGRGRPKKLPVVVPLPTKFHETVPDHEKVFPQTEVDPINELLLFYDPTMPEEAGKSEES